MTASTFESYRTMAAKRPAKALRYARSIRESLESPTIHPVEATRLDDALAGIAEGLRHAKVCRECGRALEDPESQAKGIGPDCERRLAVVS